MQIRIVGWVLSVVLHAAAVSGAALIFFDPEYWEIFACPSVAYPIRFQPLIDSMDGNRDLISHERQLWDWTGDRWSGEPSFKDGMGGPAGATLHGVEGWNRLRTGRSAESAIVAALRWLARHQGLDGGWSDRGLGCPCKSGAGESDEDLTALVLQAFQTAGYGVSSSAVYLDPADPFQELRFGEAVVRGLQFMRDVYDRDLSTEEHVRVPIPVDDAPILSSQKTANEGCFNGSWEPTPSQGRVAVTAWNTLRLIALRNR